MNAKIFLVFLLAFGGLGFASAACTDNWDCHFGEQCIRGECMAAGNECESNVDCQFWEECEFGHCMVAADYCENNDGCGGGFFCNSESHKCVLPCAMDENCEYWEYCADRIPNNECLLKEGRCNRDSDCKSGEYCAEYHSCAPQCFSDVDCNEWEHCAFLPTHNECQLDEGRCERNYDCETGQYCNKNSRRCASQCYSDADCEDWEYCAMKITHNECWLNEGACHDSSDCELGEECTSHKCVETGAKEGEGEECTVDSQCEDWEYCSGEYRCVLREGRCDDDSDCESYETCDLAGHTCLLDSGMCADAGDCHEWESCIEHACVLQEGRCSIDSDCAENEQCSDAHECKKISAWNMQPAQEINAEVLEDDTILFATGAIAVILAGIILYFVTHKGHQEEAEKTHPQKKKKPKAKPKGK